MEEGKMKVTANSSLTQSELNQLISFNFLAKVQIDDGQYIVEQEDGSSFIMWKLKVQMGLILSWSELRVEYSNAESQVWKPLYLWDETFSPDPILDLVDEGYPLFVKAIRISVVFRDGEPKYLPSIGIEYSKNNMMVTEPPIVEIFNFDEMWRKQKYEDRTELHFGLKQDPTKIYDVYYADSGIQRLKYGGVRSKDMHGIIGSGYYLLDNQNRTIITSGDVVPRTGTFVVEYVTGVGSKALVPICAIDPGPMSDVDANTIIQIHPDDITKLPADWETDSSNTMLEWSVYNEKETQGGYRYNTAVWEDKIAADFYLPQKMDEYIGRGVNFQKIGGAPDSFDAEISDYRSFWYGPNGELPPGLWQTYAKGYVYLVGPPNTVIPENIRVIAPAYVRPQEEVNLEVELSQAGTEIFEDGASTKIPNGGITPAPIIITMKPGMGNEFPDGVFARKTAAFRPRLLVYLRERTRYSGGAYWKEIGDGFADASEQTGMPYWSQ